MGGNGGRTGFCTTHHISRLKWCSGFCSGDYCGSLGGDKAERENVTAHFHTVLSAYQALGKESYLGLYVLILGDPGAGVLRDVHS